MTHDNRTGVNWWPWWVKGCQCDELYLFSKRPGCHWFTCSPVQMDKECFHGGTLHCRTFCQSLVTRESASMLRVVDVDANQNALHTPWSFWLVKKKLLKKTSFPRRNYWKETLTSFRLSRFVRLHPYDAFWFCEAESYPNQASAAMIHDKHYGLMGEHVWWRHEKILRHCN